MPSVRGGHDLTRPVALDFPRRIASRTRDFVTFVRNVLIAQLDRSRRRLNYAVSCRLVAVQNQKSFHGVFQVLDSVVNLA